MPTVPPQVRKVHKLHHLCTGLYRRNSATWRGFCKDVWIFWLDVNRSLRTNDRYLSGVYSVRGHLVFQDTLACIFCGVYSLPRRQYRVSVANHWKNVPSTLDASEPAQYIHSASGWTQSEGLQVHNIHFYRLLTSLFCLHDFFFSGIKLSFCIQENALRATDTSKFFLKMSWQG